MTTPASAPDHESTAPPVEPHRVLVLNSGSSSVKYQLLDMRDRSRLASGLVERIGEETSRLVHNPLTGGGESRERTGRMADHDAALKAAAEELTADGLGLDSPNSPRSATGWSTAGCGSPLRPSSPTRC